MCSPATGTAGRVKPPRRSLASSRSSKTARSVAGEGGRGVKGRRGGGGRRNGGERGSPSRAVLSSLPSLAALLGSGDDDGSVPGLARSPEPLPPPAAPSVVARSCPVSPASVPALPNSLILSFLTPPPSPPSS